MFQKNTLHFFNNSVYTYPKQIFLVTFYFDFKFKFALSAFTTDKVRVCTYVQMKKNLKTIN